MRDLGKPNIIVYVTQFYMFSSFCNARFTEMNKYVIVSLNIRMIFQLALILMFLIRLILRYGCLIVLPCKILIYVTHINVNKQSKEIWHEIHEIA